MGQVVRDLSLWGPNGEIPISETHYNDKPLCCRHFYGEMPHSHQLIHDYFRGRKVALHSTVSRSAGFRQLVAPNSTRPHRSTTCRSPRVTSGTSFKTISWEMGERQSTASRGVNRLAVIKSDF